MKLTIAIPTYNRQAKLRRTVTRFAEQLAASDVGKSIEILVSDNASPDKTPDVMRELIAQFPTVAIRHQRHPENLGLSGNTLSLYTGARGEYVWFFSDDDVPFPGSLERILQTLERYAPSILLFSFTQPPGSKARTYGFPEDVHLAADAPEAVGVIRQNFKLSSHIYRRSNLPHEALDRTAGLMKSCPLFGFWSLAFDVLAANPISPVAVISEPLAGSDEEYLDCFNWPPVDWQDEARVFEHPYVQSQAPQFYNDREKFMYHTAFGFFWQWRAGQMGIAEKFEPLWWEALKEFPLRREWIRPHKGLRAKALAFRISPRLLPPLMEGVSRMLARRHG